MKRTYGLVVVIAWMAIAAFAQQTDADFTGIPDSQATALTEVLNVRPAIPVGPHDLLRDYERQMTAISRQLGDELGAILQAVQKGEINPEFGDYFSEHRFELAMMKYQLLSVLHANLTKTIENAEDRGDTGKVEPGGAVDHQNGTQTKRDRSRAAVVLQEH